ncbi:hypothetical protein RhiXN_08343 [Rhizoctonia solani]|uniref:Required for respiratory growth protein 7, mitochondrial n=1 Tax=Rhizoctonia solani TaxID=456999 RepID=A0A8H8T055_9AGAM|nr:uncharacterized protein RhiXN_08343 [Rhizoctonia solani]QRW23307.1 hypothetical protein RhiXN_08343 [Rhizoctonia solani]
MTTAVSKLSTIVVGRAFEDRSLSLLQSRLSMTLTRVGGPGDGGVDLQGWWWIPRQAAKHDTNDQRRGIRVIASCKALKSKLGPVHLRELEGAALVQQHSLAETSTTGIHTSELVAVMISLSGFTPASIKKAMASPIPFLLMHLPPHEPLPIPSTKQDEEATQTHSAPTSSESSSSSDSIGSMIWNPKLGGTNGLLGGCMEVRWALSQRQRQDEAGRPVLYWKGKKLEHWVPETQDGEIGKRFLGTC